MACAAGSVFHGFGPKMVAAENDPARIDARLPGETFDEGAETRRRHTGVAAVLVDLIAGRFDENRPVAVAMSPEDRAQRLRMRSAPRGDAARTPGAIIGDDRPHFAVRAHDRSLRNASIVERWLLPSIGPTLVTARAPAALARSMACWKL